MIAPSPQDPSTVRIAFDDRLMLHVHVTWGDRVSYMPSGASLEDTPRKNENNPRVIHPRTI